MKALFMSVFGAAFILPAGVILTLGVERVVPRIVDIRVTVSPRWQAVLWVVTFTLYGTWAAVVGFGFGVPGAWDLHVQHSHWLGDH